MNSRKRVSTTPTSMTAKNPKINFDLNHFLNSYQTSTTARILVPSDAITDIEPQLGNLETDDSVNIGMPESCTHQTVVYVSSKGNQDENDVIKSVANTIARIGVLIKDVVSKGHAKLNEEEIEVRILVQNNSIGKIIGRESAGMKELKSIPSLWVDLYRPKLPSSNDRVIKIKGKDEKVFDVLVKILTTVKSRDNIKENLTGMKLEYFFNANDSLNQSNNSGSYVNLNYQGGVDGQVDVCEDKVCRLLVPSRHIGALIGKRGSMLNELRDTTCCTIDIQKSDSEDRVVTLSAKTREIVSKGLSAIIQRLKENVCENDSYEFSMLYPSHMSSLLIGQKGSTVSNLRKEFNCAVKIFNVECPNSTEKVIKIKNRDVQAIENTIEKILNILNSKHQKDHAKHNPYNGNLKGQPAPLDYGGFNGQNTGGFIPSNRSEKPNLFQMNPPSFQQQIPVPQVQPVQQNWYNPAQPMVQQPYQPQTYTQQPVYTSPQPPQQMAYHQPPNAYVNSQIPQTGYQQNNHSQTAPSPAKNAYRPSVGQSNGYQKLETRKPVNDGQVDNLKAEVEKMKAEKASMESMMTSMQDTMNTMKSMMQNMAQPQASQGGQGFNGFQKF